LLFVAGNVGRNHFLKNKYNVYMEFDYPVQNPSIYMAREIMEVILDLFDKEVFDELYIIYTICFQYKDGTVDYQAASFGIGYFEGEASN